MHGSRMTRVFQVAVSMFALAAISSATQAGVVVHVDDDGPPGGDGTTWATAYRFLQDALGFASNPANGVSEIRVAQGVYQPDRSEADPGGTGDRSSSFQLIGGVAMTGGYAGIGAPDPDAWDVELYQTILTGDLSGDDVGFLNNDENSYHVLTRSGSGPVTSLDGFTVTGGNDPRPYPEGYGGGIYTINSSLMIDDCTFLFNFARVGGGMYSETSSQTLTNCTFVGNAGDYGGAFYHFSNAATLIDCHFSDNFAMSDGGAVRSRFGSATFVGCSFSDNSAAFGGAVSRLEGGSYMLKGCTFTGNSATGGGAVSSVESTTTIQDCRFESNAALIGGGLLALNGTMTIANCYFAENVATILGGGMFDVSVSTLINSVFNGNESEFGGGLYTATNTTVVNCTFTNNSGAGLMAVQGTSPVLSNSIFWGNSPQQVVEDRQAPGASLILNSCDIQGGWSGSGSNNIDVDPLFVQPGSGDVRLAFGSPCVNAGNNAALPPDTLDLDGDGDTAEPIPLDLGGNPRIVDGTVDLGAYEGEYDPLPPMAEATDFDQGESTVLNPNGGGFDPMAYTMVAITNVSGTDDAMVMVTEWGSDNHPGAGGYSELAVTLGLETSLYNGQYGATVFVPFDLEDLAGAEPLDINLTDFDPSVGNWGLAVAGNTQNSPGSNGPIGDRIAVAGSGPGEWGLSTEMGDYGVFWNPTEQQGFAWANVDHAADFAIGAALCPVDCAQTPDGRIDVLDLIALLRVYGPSGGGGGGPCDVNQDGVVDVLDLILVLGQFGAVCP